jgi:hypothetical protein
MKIYGEKAIKKNLKTNITSTHQYWCRSEMGEMVVSSPNELFKYIRLSIRGLDQGFYADDAYGCGELNCYLEILGKEWVHIGPNYFMYKLKIVVEKIDPSYSNVQFFLYTRTLELDNFMTQRKNPASYLSIFPSDMANYYFGLYLNIKNAPIDFSPLVWVARPTEE